MGADNQSKIIFAVLLGIFFIVSAADAHRGGGGWGFNGGRRRGGPPKPNMDEVIKNVTAAVNTQPKEVLIQLFTVLTTPEAQKQLKVLKVDPTMVDQVLKKLKGTDQDVSDARKTIQTYLNGVNSKNIGRREWKAITKLVETFVLQMTREAAKKAITEDSLDTLTTGVGALAMSESYDRYRNIVFKDQLQILKTQGETGRKGVVDKLIKFIESTDFMTLNRFYFMYTMSTKFNMLSTPPPNGSSTSPSGQPTPPSGSTTPPPGQSSTSKPPAEIRSGSAAKKQ